MKGRTGKACYGEIRKHVEEEAEERKSGGRAKRRDGGIVHHEMGKNLGHAKHIGLVKGERAPHHAGRAPRD